jgi:ribosomal protein S18 acetylase RimI-like enzyme
VEKRLLNHLLETLLHTPGIERMEAQLLLHGHGDHRASFESAGFQIFPRLFLELDLLTGDPAAEVPANEQPLLDGSLRMRRWRDTDFEAATHVIAAAYRGHIDSEINDQYRSAAGASRFLHNIVRFPGCGHFEAEASWVVVESRTGELQAIMLCSRISPEVGHVTQVCVLPSLRRHHVGQKLLEVAAQCLRQLGCNSVTLTVTEANHEAVELYQKMGYRTRHGFDAMLWTKHS